MEDLNNLLLKTTIQENKINAIRNLHSFKLEVESESIKNTIEEKITKILASL